MQKENTKFELLKLDTNNLIEFEGWENKMKKVVEENPFIEIIDKETYKTAKKHLSNVRAERTSVENQDKSIASFVTAFRKKTMIKKDELVIIVKPLEDKQKIEVDRWEKIIQDEKDEKERLENQRIISIKSEIKRVHDLLHEIIEDSILSKINDFKVRFDETKESSFSFQEFDFMFHEMIDLKEKEFAHKIGELISEENRNIENLKQKRESVLNKMIVDAGKVIDEYKSNDNNLIEDISQVFQNDFFDFGEYSEEYEKSKKSFLEKAKEKLESITRFEINEAKQRVFEVREGLLDLVYQMDSDNYLEQSELIKESLNQKAHEAVQEDFNKMKSVVLKSLEQKIELLSNEIEEKNKKLSDRLEARIKSIVELGMIVQDETNSLWIGFGFEIFVDNLYDLNDSEFESLVEEIKTEKEFDENEKKRQEMLVNDKLIMESHLDILVVNNLRELNLENNESKIFMSAIIEEINDLCKKHKESINKF